MNVRNAFRKSRAKNPSFPGLKYHPQSLPVSLKTHPTNKYQRENIRSEIKRVSTPYLCSVHYYLYHQTNIRNVFILIVTLSSCLLFISNIFQLDLHSFLHSYFLLQHHQPSQPQLRQDRGECCHINP